MSDLAQATVLLTQRDSERTAVLEELRKVQEWREHGYKGLVKLDVYKVDGLPKDATLTISYELSDDSLVAKSKHLTHKVLEDVVEVFVKEKMASYVDITLHVTLPAADIEITETVTETPAEPLEEGEIAENKEEAQSSEVQSEIFTTLSTQYSVRVQMSELPDEGDMRWELEAIHLGTGESLTPSLPIIHLKMNFDAFDLLLNHKMTQLEQAQEAFDEATLKVKEAKRSSDAEKKKAAAPSSPTPGKKSEKGKKKSKKVSMAASESDEPEKKGTVSTAKPGQPWSQYVQDAGTQALGLLVQHHAVVLFGAAVVGIINYGEYASV